MIGSNFTSQNPSVQVIGLGSATSADEVLVEWPPVVSGATSNALGTLLNGPVPATQPGHTLVISHPALPVD
jgi:hypothetical protein